jgi:hypothetical protein
MFHRGRRSFAGILGPCGPRSLARTVLLPVAMTATMAALEDVMSPPLDGSCWSYKA